MNLTDLTNVNTYLVLGAFAAALGFFFLSFKRQTVSATRESNEILRSFIDDQKQEILKLRERQHDMVNAITALKLQVQHLADRRDYLEKLVNAALREHFSRDPGVADAVKQSLDKPTLAPLTNEQ